MIIELAGLPGAGKTTICRAVNAPVGGKGSVALLQLKPDREWRRASAALFALALSAKPFKFQRVKRAFNLCLFLRHYQSRASHILLDQGLVQKLWSLLVDSASFDEAKLGAVLQILKPFAPDMLIWLETPLAHATQRMSERVDGNSRYDGLTAEEATRLLAQRQGLLIRLQSDFVRATGCRSETLSGEESAVVNAARIEELLRALA